MTILSCLFYRAEQQRNQALENAEKLKEAFSHYKATTSIKLKTVHSLTRPIAMAVFFYDMFQMLLGTLCFSVHREPD